MLCSLYVVCCVLVMDVYNDKVVGNSDNTTADTVTYNESEAVSIPEIEDITKDNNFVDVSNIVYTCGVCACVSVSVMCMCMCMCVYTHMRMGGGQSSLYFLIPMYSLYCVL